MTKAIDKLIKDIDENDWKNQIDLNKTRTDADNVHSDGFYFFDINIHRTMILIEFQDGEATVVWAGTHQEYETTFKNNRNTIKKWFMETQFNISELIDAGKIQSELDFERALIADRKLRILSKENPRYKTVRKKLRDLIEQYESQHWSADSKISDEKLLESDVAEFLAEKERLFIQRRKELIRKKLKNLNLTQQDFGKILGHQSKSYMSELMNGVSPFSLKDLIVINRLLKIELVDLVPTILSQSEIVKIRTTIKKLDNPKLKLSIAEMEQG